MSSEHTEPVVCRLAVVALAAVLAAALPVAAQPCLTMLPGNVFDTTSTCASEPMVDRALGAEQMSWNGRDYLFVNIGNEIAIYDITAPANPMLLEESTLRVGNQGNSDYDLLSFAVCDDCRWGVAWFKLGTVLFDLGVGATPTFADKEIVYGATFALGGMTFTAAGRQYLITASGLDGSCDGTSTLFTIDGYPVEQGVTRVACVVTDTRSVLAAGGLELDGYLYLADASTRVYLFRIDPTDQGSITLAYLDEPMRASMGRDDGLAIDAAHKVAVEANIHGAHVWDLTIPGSPRLTASIAGSYDRAAVAWPRMFVTQGGVAHAEHTYDISRLDFPVALDQAFWSPANDWNHADHLCTWTQAAHLSPDASSLYLLRYSRIEVVDASDCATPELGALYLLPAAARTAGNEGSFFLTDVDLNNADTVDASYRILWLPRGEDNADPVTSAMRTIAAGTSEVISDVLGTVFGLSDDAVGAIAVVADTPRLLLTSRTFNRTDQGTFGQGLPGYAADELIPVNTRRRILFMVESSTFRSNLGLANGSDRGITVFWERFTADGHSLGVASVDLPPWGNTQLNSIFADVAPVNGGFVDVWTTTEEGRFAAYGSMLDNATSDPTTILPR